MGLSKEHRIAILLGIDTAFFFLELIVGYTAHSLALVADAFHMLNDVLSLCVGLWAVRVARTGRSNAYTYGLQRAETLGALVNGVFLVALCMTIFLEAVQRIFEPQVVNNPELVCGVGAAGLLSNILGLFLFHDHGHGHGHDHGEAGHSHSHDQVRSAEEGHARDHSHSHSHDHGHAHAHKAHTDESTPLLANGKQNGSSKADGGHGLTGRSPETHRKSITASGNVSIGHKRRTSAFGSADNIPVHPASMRQEFVRTSHLDDLSEPESEEAVIDEARQANGSTKHSHQPHGHDDDHNHNHDQDHIVKQSHARHHHAQPRKEKAGGGGGHGHSHADMNMRGVFLHVLGDALGNVGVIISAAIIWRTDWPFRYYFDPAISLVITVIILYSAIPLCKAASRILLQAVPIDIDIEEITEDIETLDGVISAHDLHVWQLSGTKLVASIHVKVNCEIKGAGSGSYMRLAREIQECLHEYGIHSSTIQPEFVSMETSLLVDGSSSSNAQTSRAGSKTGSKAPSLASADGVCMLDCEESCNSKGQCCPPNAQDANNNATNAKTRK